MELYFHFPCTLMACTGTNLAVSFSYVLGGLTSSCLIGCLVQRTGSVLCSENRNTDLRNTGKFDICRVVKIPVVIGVMMLRYHLVSWFQPILVVGQSEA